MKKLYTLFSLLICMFIAGQSMAQINMVGDTIHNDTIWTDTVNVIDNIYIPDTVTLTIQPGTYVQFADSYYIKVDGSVNAMGALNDSITFIGDSTGFSTLSHVGWRGFSFDEPESNDSSFFSFCIFMYLRGPFDYDAVFYTNDFSNLVVENSRFSYNYNNNEASCFQIEEAGNSMIRNNLFTHNYSYYSCIQLGCATVGPNTTIIGNTFMYNYGYNEGSCLKISAFSQAHVINNVFQHNYSEGNGGAICISGYANPTLIGNLIEDNYSESKGGGIAIKYHAHPNIINNTIVNNYTEGNGGGIQVSCSSINPLFQNNIIWGNEALGNGYQVYIDDSYGTAGFQFINNIMQDSIYYEYNNVNVGLEINTIYSSPMFLDSANGNYHFSCGSPAINGGIVPMTMLPPFDLDGNMRIDGSTIDIGAYEYVLDNFILTDPQNTQVSSGQIANFAISAPSATAFQWMESTDYGSTWVALSDNSTYSGATTNTLAITTSYTMNGYMYKCEVEGNCPGVINESNDAILFVDYNVGISENTNDIMVYPNPSKDNFFIQGAEGANITISDLNGRIIESRYDLGSDKEMISLTEYEKGMYILRVIQDENTSIIKIIKE